MEEKKQSIFRKKSLDRISTPEDLDKYLNVTGPGVWFPLLAVVVLLIGVFVWMILGHLDTSLNVAVVSADESVVCYVPADRVDSVMKSGTVTIGSEKYQLKDDGRSVQLINAETDLGIRLAGALDDGEIVKPLRVDTELPEGVYDGEIIVETINPITFIIN